MSSSSKNWGNLKSGKRAISLSDSDEGDVGEKPTRATATMATRTKNPLLAPVQKAALRAELAAAKCNDNSKELPDILSSPIAPIDERVVCTNPDHGPECPGGMPSCVFQLVVHLTEWREYVRDPVLGRQEVDAKHDALPDFCEASQRMELEPDTLAGVECVETQPEELSGVECAETQPEETQSDSSIE